jgi:outer membrane immunogenic protein
VHAVLARGGTRCESYWLAPAFWPLLASEILDFPALAMAQQAPYYAAGVPGWQGFYAGVNGGVGWGDSPTSVSTVSTFENTAALSALGQTYGPNGTVSVSSTHFIGGGQLGYNFPLASRWVAGLEGELDYYAGTDSITETNTLARPGFPGNFVQSGITVSKKLSYLATVRPRLGFLVQPALLVYATGGLVIGQGQSSTNLTAIETPVNTGSTNVQAFGQSSKTMPGYGVGAGVEWMMGNSWSLKAEYLYYSLGNLSYANTPFSATLFANGATDFTANSTSKTRFSGDVFRLGLNYHS